MNFDISSISAGYDAGDLTPRDIAQKVEAMFMELLIETMEKSVNAEGGLYGDSASSEIYRGLFRQDLAMALSADLETPLRLQLEEAIARAADGSSERPEGGADDDGPRRIERPDPPSIRPVDDDPGPFRSGTTRPDHVSSVGLPVDGTVTSFPGWRQDPITGERSFHAGTDIAAPSGTPIRATVAGHVVESGSRGSYGNTVVLEADDGRRLLFAHNQMNTVDVGDRVRAGDVIALVGSTGRSTGPHVHVEVFESGE